MCVCVWFGRGRGIGLRWAEPSWRSSRTNYRARGGVNFIFPLFRSCPTLFWQVSPALFNPSSDDARRGQRDALRSPTTLREVQRRRGRGGPLGRVMGLGRLLRVYDGTSYVQGEEKASLAVQYIGEGGEERKGQEQGICRRRQFPFAGERGQSSIRVSLEKPNFLPFGESSRSSSIQEGGGGGGGGEWSLFLLRY